MQMHVHTYQTKEGFNEMTKAIHVMAAQGSGGTFAIIVIFYLP